MACKITYKGRIIRENWDAFIGNPWCHCIWICGHRLLNSVLLHANRSQKRFQWSTFLVRTWTSMRCRWAGPWLLALCSSVSIFTRSVVFLWLCSSVVSSDFAYVCDNVCFMYCHHSPIRVTWRSHTVIVVALCVAAFTDFLKIATIVGHDYDCHS